MKAAVNSNGIESVNDSGIFEAVLSSGREVGLREMKTMDLIFMEKQARKDKAKTETERTMAVLERLSVAVGSSPKITVPEMQELNLADFRILTDLMAEAGGIEEDPEQDMEDA